ncbi:MAG: hypothetical protein A2289_24890 [Deltaproteobacteria bacterium RIFOXYA12_FULL_58_15]|nr:MAG: hypothetical protein A2289_24890 [Deltaproteobacteria bacterium RIFOXYA12_FULL_58_15]OGR09170.1 MAG: hypothetical protein A2341_24500 [Deltaproteobacteria bacterium RIFOXYB12_FULL_58_9]
MEIPHILDIQEGAVPTTACRRRYHRSAVKWQVKMGLSDGTSVLGVVRDVSAFGVFVQFAQIPPELTVGSRIDMQIALPQPGRVVQTTAKVCWCGLNPKYNHWGIGVELQSRCQSIADYFGCDGAIDKRDAPTAQQWDMVTPAVRDCCPPTAIQSSAMLISLDSSTEGLTYPLRNNAVIGRGSLATIRIDDSTMSRAHASIEVGEDGTHVLTDLDSRNGTRVNGKTTSGCTLKDGDTVAFGDVVFRFIHQPELDKRLQESQRMETIGRLAFAAVHDVRNLLTVVTMVADVAANQQLDAQTKKSLKLISDATISADNIMNQLMGLARTSSAEHIRIGVTEMVDKVAQLCRHAFPKNIEINADLPDNLAAMGNHSQLEQVLLNLCMNARDAIGNAKGELRVKGKLHRGNDQASSAGGHLVLEVSDTGCGMDKETQERAFEPYFTTKEAGHGTGIGLAVAQKLINRMQGDISLKSSPGKGTTVTITLPAAS